MTRVLFVDRKQNWLAILDVLLPFVPRVGERIMLNGEAAEKYFTAYNGFVVVDVAYSIGFQSEESIATVYVEPIG